jgi:hypothetical protein
MAEQRKRIFDCDQHMYEERDSFTRYLPKEFLGAAVAPVTLPDGREVILAGDRIVVCLEPEFGQVYRPGSLKEMLKAMASGNPRHTSSSRCTSRTRTARPGCGSWTSRDWTRRSSIRAAGRWSPRST